MVKFGSVQGKAARVAVIATGPSVRDCDPALLLNTTAFIIAVNRAIEFLPRADAWFTLDPDARTRPIMANRRAGVTYYAAVPDDYGEPKARALAHRAPAEEGIIYLKRAKGLDPHAWGATLSMDKRSINTGNSAWGAFQAAFLMSAKRIVLLGVDGTPKGYAYDHGDPRDLNLLPWVMGTAKEQLAAAGVEVRTGNPKSRVTAFPRMTANHALEWLTA